MNEFILNFYSVTKIDGGLVFISESDDDMMLNSNLLDDWRGDVKGNDFDVTSKNANLNIRYKNLSGVNGYLPSLLAKCLRNGYVAVLVHEKGTEDGHLIHVSSKASINDEENGEVQWD